MIFRYACPAVCLLILVSYKIDAAEGIPPQNVKEGIEQIRTVIQSQLKEDEKLADVLKLVEFTWKLNPTTDEKKALAKIKAGRLMSAYGNGDDAIPLMLTQLILDLASDPDPEIVKFGREELLEIRLHRYPFLPEDEQSVTRETTLAHALSVKPSDETLQLASLLSYRVAQAPDIEMTTEINNKLIQHFRASRIDSHISFVEELEGTNQRISLVGNPLNLVGHFVDGKELNWANYHGKVVLVDFWSTGCGQCIKEFPRLKEFLGTYGPHGFEIVGVSLDTERDRLEAFLEKRNLPWPILFNGSADGRFGDSNSRKYGITGLPTCFLVGRNGKVISIQARGEELEKLLQTEFPDVTPPPTEEAP